CVAAGARAVVIPEPYYIYSTPVGRISGKSSPTRRTNLRFDAMAEDNRRMERQYAGVLSAKAAWLFRKRRQQLMARHHADVARQLKQEGRLLHFAAFYISHPGMLGLKLALRKQRQITRQRAKARQSPDQA